MRVDEGRTLSPSSASPAPRQRIAVLFKTVVAGAWIYLTLSTGWDELSPWAQTVITELSEGTVTIPAWVAIPIFTLAILAVLLFIPATRRWLLVEDES